MRSPIVRNIDGLVARYKEAEDRALESVPQPEFNVPPFGDRFRDAPKSDSPEWYHQDYAAYQEYRTRSRAARDAAVLGAFTAEEMTAFTLANRESSDDTLWRASQSAHRGLKTLAVQQRHAYLLKQKAAGVLHARVCPACYVELPEASWDPTPDDKWGGYAFRQPHTCGSDQCESAFTRDDTGIAKLAVDWGHCCIWCQHWYKLDLAPLGECPPEEGQPDHDPEASAAWERQRVEHCVFKSFCGPWCHAVGVGDNVFDDCSDGWEPGSVPREWKGNLWPRVEYLARPPITDAERKKFGEGRWERSVLVEWTGTTPALVGGKPPQWMLRSRLWKEPIKQYVARLEAIRAAQHALRAPLVLGEAHALRADDALRALPEAVQDAEFAPCKPTALDRYVAYLRARGPATDGQAVKAGLNASTIRGLRSQHPESFSKEPGSRPTRWRVVE
jgi:hypothetical protein